jgi:hypothetical protein
MLLEHDAAFRRRPRERLPLEINPATRWRLEAGEDIQKRGLAASAGPKKSDELAGADLERDVVDRGTLTTAERHAYMFEAKARNGLPCPRGALHEMKRRHERLSINREFGHGRTLARLDRLSISAQVPPGLLLES